MLIKGDDLVLVFYLLVYNYEDQDKDYEYIYNNFYGQYKNQDCIGVWSERFFYLYFQRKNIYLMIIIIGENKGNEYLNGNFMFEK